MKEWADLLRAVATLLWPILGFVALFSFRSQIRDLLIRLRKGKLFGQEIELGDSLARLGAAAVKTASEVAALPLTIPALTTGEPEDDPSELERRVLEEAGRSPKAALLLLASEMEREVRQLLAAQGLLGSHRIVSFPQAIQLLDQRGGLLRHVASSVDLFWNLRNQLVHGRRASEDDILRAVDSGLTILRAVKAIPHEQNTVAYDLTEVFSDEQGQAVRNDVRAIILRTKSPGRATTSIRVFPTTRTHFKVGMRVAWEWSFDKSWGASWYRDPVTGNIKTAWSTSVEFVGRDLEDV